MMTSLQGNSFFWGSGNVSSYLADWIFEVMTDESVICKMLSKKQMYKVSNYVVVVNRVILLNNIVSSTDAVALIFSGYDKQRSNHNKVFYIHIKSLQSKSRLKDYTKFEQFAVLQITLTTSINVVLKIGLKRHKI